MAKKTAKKPAKPAEARKKAATSSKPQGGNVAIVGGGIAGLAAAIKLLKAGFSVTIFERHDRLGGNTSSDLVNGIEHDVYPHMLCDWYVNFWDLFENDLGLSRDEHFEPRGGVKMMREGEGGYKELLNPTSMDAIVRNLKSGAMSPAEMFLMGYSMVDLAGYPFNREGFNQLDKLSVNGFLYSQSTTTEDVAELENYILQVIWSIQSEHTSAVTYQDFIRHTLTFPNGAPFAWMLKDSLQTGLIAPIEALLKKLGATIRTSTEVTAVRLQGDEPKIWWSGTGGSSRAQSASFDQVVIAVPHGPLTDLVMGGTQLLKGDRLIDREPSLSQVRRLRSVPIPVIDLYLKTKLPDFPAENIGLTGALYGLSVVDISQLWRNGDFGGKSALVVAASDGESLPGHDFQAQAWYMLQELVRFYPDIAIGAHWGDPDSDVDWDNTHARSNADYGLFLNDVGCWDWMPDTAYPATMPNIVFAGDLCRGNVNMATVEGAVESGILAAAAVQSADARMQRSQRGAAIEIRKHSTYGDTALRAAKLALMPFAYAAKAVTLLDPADKSASPLKLIGNALQSEHAALLPMQFAVDWWTTAYWFWHAALSPDEGDTPDGPSNHSDDAEIGLGAAMLMVLGELACYASGKAEDCLSGTRNEPPDPAHPYKRRWHPKR